MYYVGKPPVAASDLTEVCFEAMWRGIRTVKPGTRLGDIGHAIQEYVESLSFSVVREYCGHGIGPHLPRRSADPALWGARTGLELKQGMTFTVEPMVNAGKRHVRLLPMAGPWSPRTIPCRPSGNTPAWSLKTGVDILTLGAGRPTLSEPLEELLPEVANEPPWPLLPGCPPSCGPSRLPRGVPQAPGPGP